MSMTYEQMMYFYAAELWKQAKHPTMTRMGDLPANQPFVCDHCHVVFGSRRALEAHQAEPHRRWELSEMDKKLLISFRIKVDE